MVTRIVVGTWLLGLLLGVSPHPLDRYIVNVLIRTPDGASIAAIVIRKSGPPVRRPAALEFTIYATPAKDLKYAKYAADRGYVGVVATRAVRPGVAVRLCRTKTMVGMQTAL